MKKATKPKPTKRIRWQCTDCRRRGTVRVKDGELLDQVVSDVYDAHNEKDPTLNCFECAMHITLL